MKDRWTKLTISILAALTLLLAAGGRVDQAGYDYTEQGFRRALVTFAVARGLNAVISVAQGTELAVAPAGVGVTFTPGEVLDPINDLVERFSWVMLASATSLGIQRLLLDLFASPVFTGLFGLALVLSLGALWTLPRPALREALFRATLVLLVLRFAVPVVAAANEALYTGFLQPRYESSSQAIEQTTEQIRRINRAAEAERAAAPDPSVLDRARRWYESALESLDVQAWVERYQAAASDVSEQVINLIVIFVVQTVLLPLLFLWGLVRLLRQAVRLRIES